MVEVVYMAFATECDMRFAFSPVGDGTADLELHVFARGRTATEAEILDGIRLARDFLSRLDARLKTRDRVHYEIPQ